MPRQVQATQSLKHLCSCASEGLCCPPWQVVDMRELQLEYEEHRAAMEELEVD